MPGGVTQYVLKGGPCDGKTGQLTPGIEQSGQLTCSDHIYRITSPVQNDGGREVFVDAGKVGKNQATPIAPHAHQGWSDLAHTVNKKWHPTLNKRGELERTTLRALQRASKVRF